MKKTSDFIFTGISYHTLDEKNRLFLPNKYRSGTKKYVLTCGIDNCIVIYSYNQWQQAVKRIETISIKNKTYQRAFVRNFFAEAEVVEIDIQGRILIHKKFKEKYHLNNEVVLVGNRDKLELWSKEEWEKYYNKTSRIIRKIKTQIDI
ncbi:MAG: division/cell wall cluster transcriptional repressor MraZ [Endomicrobiia bacterium]